MHPDALNVRTQVYHSAVNIVTLIEEVFLNYFEKEVRQQISQCSFIL